MKIKLDLYHPYELEAFAAFSAAVAAGKAAYDAAQPKDNFGLAGLINRAQDSTWRVGGAVGGPVAEVQVDEATQTAEPEPVATPAPAEKKTRSRKAKDAPAVSVSSVDIGGQTDIEDAIAATAALKEFNEKGGSTLAEVKAAISAGEERIGPEDSPEVVAQDEADEKAESDAARDPEKPLTLDDVRSALGEYVRVYGMAAAQEDGPKVITLVCGEGKVKVSDVPDDKVAAVVSGVKEMSEKNPFKREKVAA